MPAVLNAANEAAVGLFLEEKTRFGNIPGLIEQTMDKHISLPSPSLAQIMDADIWARRHVREGTYGHPA